MTETKIDRIDRYIGYIIVPLVYALLAIGFFLMIYNGVKCPHGMVLIAIFSVLTIGWTLFLIIIKMEETAEMMVREKNKKRQK